jgi:hypothetical protein
MKDSPSHAEFPTQEVITKEKEITSRLQLKTKNDLFRRERSDSERPLKPTKKDRGKKKA